MTTRPFWNWIYLGLALVVLAGATEAPAQSQAEAKRTLKAQKILYVQDGLIEVEVQAMRGGILMMSGYTPTEELKAKAEELVKDVRGIKDIRNRIKVREPDDALISLSKVYLAAEGDEEKQLPRLGKAYARRVQDLAKWPDTVEVKIQTIRIGDLGESAHAEGLLVELPRDPEKRRIVLWQTARAQGREASVNDDRGQSFLEIVLR